jgi:hypothetical protein
MSVRAQEDDMAVRIRRVDYFYLTMKDQPGEAYKLLALFADRGIDLLAFTAVPMGEQHTQLTIFPEDPGRLATDARNIGLALDGPHPALLVQGDDELGALADVHRRLYEANVNVYAASGVADGKRGFGYVIYVQPDDFQRAALALDV